MVCPVECNAECCRRWWITLLPEELEKAVAFTGLERKRFVEEKCVLFAELFPLTEKKSGIVVFSGLLPRSLAGQIRESFGFLPDFFLALPALAFKRPGQKCVFLNESNLCSIYPARPRQCTLFPSISVEGKPSDLYGFCPLARNARRGIDQEHFQRLTHYYSEVEGRGFSALWAHLPREAIVKVNGNEFRVSRQDFLGLLGPYS